MSTPTVDDVVDDIVKHFGVKGMRWGIRKEVHPDIADVPKATRKEAAKDAEEFTRAKLFFGEGAGVRRRLIKAKVEAKKTKDKLYAKAFDHFVKETDLSQRASQARSQRKRKDAAKSTKRAVKIASRFITPGTVSALQETHRNFTLAQSDESFIDDILSHHGVKGMRWGVRRKATVGPQEVIISDKRKKLRATGGKGHPATSEAISARTSGQIAKKSGVKALSNAQLRAYNERLNLEQNFNRLTFNEKSSGEKFVRTLLGKKGPGVAGEGAKKLNDPEVRRKIKAGAAARVAALAIATA